jgi:protein-disulfide isomerase
MWKAASIAVAALAAACSKNSSDARAATSSTPAAQPTAAPAAPAEDNTPPPGIDLSPLDEFERKVFFRVLNKEPSACGKAHSLMFSLKNDQGCRKSVYAARYVVKLVDSGFTDSEVAEKLQKRFRGGPLRTIDVAEAPMKGSPAARVTLIEFVDYECPHCKRAQPVIRQTLDEFKSEVRVYFKHYPLPSHPNARLAAEAAVAAQKQGKFWPYNDGVWAHAEELSPAMLEKIAKDVGLDVEKWRKDLDSEDVRQRVQKDRSEGEGLSISSTPTLYVNGRKYSDPVDTDSLKDWVNEELGR